MTKLSFAGCATLLALIVPMTFTATLAFAEDPVVSDGTGEEGEPIVVEGGPAVDIGPVVDEPSVSDGDGSEGEPIVVDDGVEYDPAIAENRGGDPAPNQRGGGGVAVKNALPGGSGSGRSDDGTTTYKMIQKGNKFYKIPVQ
jgi:hypothetical protein